MQTDRDILLKILAAQVLIVGKLKFIESKVSTDSDGANLSSAIQEIARNEERILKELFENAE